MVREEYGEGRSKPGNGPLVKRRTRQMREGGGWNSAHLATAMHRVHQGMQQTHFPVFVKHIRLRLKQPLIVGMIAGYGKLG